MTQIAYLVTHTISRDGIDQIRTIGLFSTRDHAEAAVATLSSCDGFSDARGQFIVEDCAVDNVLEWTSGFVWLDEGVAAFAGWVPDIDDLVPVHIGHGPHAYLLEHVRTAGALFNNKLLGVFSSPDVATAAVRMHFLRAPGFRALPEGFRLVGYTLDQHLWRGGFRWNDYESHVAFTLESSE